MDQLIAGVRQFQANVFPSKQILFEDLAHAPHPQTAFITCSDSRIDPNLLTQSEPGKLFTIRNPGNIVPPVSSSDIGVRASIEYAVSYLKVKEIVICGHSRCGAMEGLLNPDSIIGLPGVRSWLTFAQKTFRLVNENYGEELEDYARLMAAVQTNVLVQMEHLRTHPCVAAAIARHELTIHGWVYKLKSGKVFAFDDEKQQFVVL